MNNNSKPGNTSSRSSDPILTPTSSTASSDSPQSSGHSATIPPKARFSELLHDKMDSARADQPTTEDVQLQQKDEAIADTGVTTNGETKAITNGDEVKPPNLAQKKKKKSKCKKRHGVKAKQSSKKRKSKDDSSDSSSSSSSDSDCSSDSDTSDSSTEEERKKKKEKKKKAAKRASKSKSKKNKRSKRYESSSDDSSSDSDDESTDSESSEEDRRSRKHRRSKRSKRRRDPEETDAETTSDELADDTESEEQNVASLEAQLNALKLALLARKSGSSGSKARQLAKQTKRLNEDLGLDVSGRKKKKRSPKKKGKKGSTLEYKRVDQLWDSTIHNYKLTESAEDQVDEFDEFIFTVRRKFDWENKYRNTVVDIKSKPLRDALQEIMKDVKGVSLVEEEPCVDPNMLFLYLEEMKAYRKKVLKARVKKEKKKKLKKRLNLQMSHLKVMESYLNEDYAETKKTLYPMLEAGNITFELLWALFKPNTVAFCSTYGSAEDPRCFKVDYANKESSFMRGEWYSIEGRYLEYDGKSFGLGDFEMTIDSFKGSRKITSLATYPLKYNKDPEAMTKQLVERGKKFVSMQGMHYKFLKGLGFQKKKKAVAKVNISGRVMIDPAIFRRINPNYPISMVRNKDEENMFGGSDDGSCSDCCGGSDSEEDKDNGEGPQLPGEEPEEKERFKYTFVKDHNKEYKLVQVLVDEEGRQLPVENLEAMDKDGEPETFEFTEEELLIASPVVLGFAFSEKLWLEFSLSGIKDIEWNEGAFQSLVLPANQKSIVKGMVSSHKFNAAKRIDDVVQGKGRGLVFVLHGPPGVGKTLTAEGIAEFLRCPLYSVSAGELGTDSRVLEHELQKIMDIAHSWGAVLLLDEADVFLEKREVHDIHRNALVSIFLRLLEYFQGILFLTTNRVETFDDAFQSRIHMPLRYGELTAKAKKEIWKTFVDRVRTSEGMEVNPFTEQQFNDLARNKLNGRQIKNAVRTAQSLALSEDQTFSIEHIKRVLEVAEDFDHDLKGGTGYIDAMRSYT